MVNTFLVDMELLPCATPEVQQGFQCGDVFQKTTKKLMPSTRSLIKLFKHVNKSGKVAGGLVIQKSNVQNLQGIIDV